jgi:hypothetical protein
VCSCFLHVGIICNIQACPFLNLVLFLEVCSRGTSTLRPVRRSSSEKKSIMRSYVETSIKRRCIAPWFWAPHLHHQGHGLLSLQHLVSFFCFQKKLSDNKNHYRLILWLQNCNLNKLIQCHCYFFLVA